MAEVSERFHQKYYSTIHENTGQAASKIDRAAAREFREKYWMERAAEIEKRVEELQKR